MTEHRQTSAPEAHAGAEGFQAVIFQVGRQRYALPLATVLQVVRLPALTRVPDAPQQQAGLLNLHGAFVSVVDGRAVLDECAAPSLESQIIIMGDRAGRHAALGLLVDAVEGVERFPHDSLTALDGDGLVAALLRERDTAVLLLNPEALRQQA
jgi:chemotaxis signal transduction protein